MILGILELPNKWVSLVHITGKPFLYENRSLGGYTNPETWGGSIPIVDNMHTYKIVAQTGYKVTEYWCIGFDHMAQYEKPGFMFPVAMKRYGYKNGESKFFVFKEAVVRVIASANYDSRMYGLSIDLTREMNKYSPAEYLLMGFEDSEPWPDYSEMYRNKVIQGADLVRFPHGNTIHISEILHRCSNVVNYSRNIMHQIDECSTPHDLGITTGDDIINFFLDYTPCDPSCTYLELDHIGEQILSKNLVGFYKSDIMPLVMHSPAPVNTFSMLSNASKQEELVVVENLVNHLITDRIGTDSTHDDIQDTIDDIITSFYRDEATTIVYDYNYNTTHLTVVDRILGYGQATLESCRGMGNYSTADQVSFALHYLCELISASRIRIIKTYNEEMYMTVWFEYGLVESYYYNLIIHSCVTGALFTL